eukprot:gene19644-biopygen39910
MSVLKRLGQSITPYVAALANEVIGGRQWPEAWKRAEVHPLWKRKGCKNDPTMYRPISMLPAIARVVERMVGSQLKEHVVRLFPKFQHGFRRKHSCETALVQLVDLVVSARDKGEVALVASADMAAAFDTVDHTILGDKLQKLCNVSGDALQLLNNYLKGRTQRVVMSGERKSTWQPVVSGVPQGSVLGPLLFALYTIDIGNHVKGCEIVQYADDITVMVSASTADEAVEKANSALAQLAAYATTNRLAPEPSKTQLLAVGSHRRLNAPGQLVCEMGKHKIRPTETIKVLGVLLDQRLSWENQAAAAARKALNAARTVKSASRHMRFRRDRGKFMRALAHPHLDYCQSALANPTEAAASFLRRAYHRTARVAART